MKDATISEEPEEESYSSGVNKLESTREQSSVHVTGNVGCLRLFLALQNHNINIKTFSRKTSTSNLQTNHMHDPNCLC